MPEQFLCPPMTAIGSIAEQSTPEKEERCRLGNRRGRRTTTTIASGVGGRTASARVALTQCRASLWLADARRWADQTVVLANRAMLLWPPLAAKGQTVGGVTVGQRTNNVELCVLCGKPVQPGNTRRVGVDSDPVCKNPCWYTLTRAKTHQMRQIITANHA